MSSTTKNIAYVLVALTLTAGISYYFLQSQGETNLSGGQAVLTDEILISTQLFIERRNILEKVRLDTSVLDSLSVRSYRSFSGPVEPLPFGGRPNPFIPTNEKRLFGN